MKNKIAILILAASVLLCSNSCQFSFGRTSASSSEKATGSVSSESENTTSEKQNTRTSSVSSESVTSQSTTALPNTAEPSSDTDSSSESASSQEESSEKENSSATTEIHYEYPSITQLDILEINDLHGYAYASSQDDRINLATAAYYVNEVRDEATYDNVLLIANGDMFQGTAFSNLSYGKSVINAMNEMNFDVMGIGNHEFDWGLDKILAYFDNDPSNGEANFPLINGNISYTSGNSLGKTANDRVGEKEQNDNILPYTIVHKSGVNVGVISYIGPLTNDINANKMFDYYINVRSTADSAFYDIVRNDAIAVRKAGADIVVLNTHNGTSSGVEDDVFDQHFAALKDDDGNYLIDAVVNGHTHTYQYGSISRSGGLELPIVQGGSYGNAVGRITLSLNTASKKVVSVDSERYYYMDSTVGYEKKDSSVQQVLEYEYSLIADQIAEVYTVNKRNAAKSYLGSWAANVMKKYTGADVAFMNTGGIRSTLSYGNVTIAELYEINPFDNLIDYVLAKGKDIKAFHTNYYYYNTDYRDSDFEDDKVYKVATIDYVYYGSYFKKGFASGYTLVKEDTVCERDLLLLDCKAKGSSGMDLTSSTEASLETAGWPAE